MPKVISLHDVLEPLKQALLAARDVITSSQICGSKLQKKITLGDGCWLPIETKSNDCWRFQECSLLHRLRCSGHIPGGGWCSEPAKEHFASVFFSAHKPFNFTVPSAVGWMRSSWARPSLKIIFGLWHSSFFLLGPIWHNHCVWTGCALSPHAAG